MRAAALQFDVTPDLEHNLDFVRDQLHVAAAAGIQLVVLPEMWASSFPSSKDGLAEQAARERQAVAVLRELSEELELCLAGSALVEEQGEFYNRLQVLDAGRELLRYDKVHLFSPTAEKGVLHGRQPASGYGGQLGWSCLRSGLLRPALSRALQSGSPRGGGGLRPSCPVAARSSAALAFAGHRPSHRESVLLHRLQSHRQGGDRAPTNGAGVSRELAGCQPTRAGHGGRPW